MRLIFAVLLALACMPAPGQDCFRTSVMAPSPLMGNHGEIFRIADGAMYEVVGSYEYLYAYYSSVTICPSRGKMLVEGKTVGISPLQASGRKAAPSDGKGSNRSGQRAAGPSDAPITIVFRMRSCDYFIADGPRGHYVLEWYGGYDPERGDGIFGELDGYGFKDVLYAGYGMEGSTSTTTC